MKLKDKYLNLVLDSITEHIVVIDASGEIQYVNASWTKFGNDNTCNIVTQWEGVNYLTVCDQSSSQGDEFGSKAGNGIRSVINKDTDLFYFEYPCHGPRKKRWFMMRVTPFKVQDKDYYVISHQNITERKLAEEKVKKLARIDGLTQILNRRTFNEFLDEEWKRCIRLQKPISLAIIDLDHFKLLNDTYGHQAGDDCLKEIGKLLKKFAKRPSDICARYGGEEFALVFGDTTVDKAQKLANDLLKKISDLRIENKNSPIKDYLTASIGVAKLNPEKNTNASKLIELADKNLYYAKESGWNRVAFTS